jgi:UDP-N-acetyl-D-mannosaminuronic acid dehydrogenase
MAQVDERIALIGGAGHVGLPLAIVLAQRGCQVTIVDVDRRRLELVREGRMPFFEQGAEPALREVLAQGRLTVTSDPSTLPAHDVVLVVIGTPIDPYLSPTVGRFEQVLGDYARYFRSGQFIALRSTVVPGTTERVAERLSRQGLNVDVAYCPERIAEGRALEELTGLPQWVAGVTPEASARAAALFSRLTPEIVRLSPREAEYAKLLTNAWRYLTFAIANQFYMLAQDQGLDYARLHHAITYRYPRAQALPGPGFAAGLCLMKDTMQLSAVAGPQFALGPLAMQINEGLPRFIVDALRREYDLTSLTVGILGMAFKGDIDDARDSLSYKLRKLLLLECREVLCADPYVQDPALVSQDTVLERADLVIIAVRHTVYRDLVFPERVAVVDLFHALGGGPVSAPLLLGTVG